MKVLLCFLISVVTYTSSNAQIFASAKPLAQDRVVSPLILQSGQRVLYKISRPPGQRMMRTGMILTIAGAAMITGGIIVAANGDPNETIGYTSGGVPVTDEDGHEALGQVMIGVGAGMAVPGVIFWVKGAKKYKRSVENQASFNFKPTGLSLSYKF